MPQLRSNAPAGDLPASRKAKKRTHRKGKQRPPNVPPSSSPAVPINALKSQIRQLARHLARSASLPADVRQEKERELHALRNTLAKAIVQRNRRTTLGRYHMVRFFERQKASRAVRRLQKEIDAIEAGGSSHDESAQNKDLEPLKTLHHIAQIDLWYTTHAPLEDIYLSLFPKEAREKEEQPPAQIHAHRPPVWHLVERAVADGSIEQVRDGTHPALEALGLGERVALQAKLAELEAKTAGLDMAEEILNGQVQGKHGTKGMGERDVVVGVKKKGGARKDARKDEKGMEVNVPMDVDRDGESDGGFFET